MGFGLFNDTEFSALLLEAQINVLDFDECTNVYSERLDSNTQICAGSVTAAIGSCFDDEGGPLIHATEDIQYGIFSFTESCMSIAPQIYTDVTRYTEFIEAGICELSSNPPSSCGAIAPDQSVAPSLAPIDTPVATIAPIAPSLNPPNDSPIAPIAQTAPSLTPPNDPPVTSPVQPALLPSSQSSAQPPGRDSLSKKKNNEKSGKHASGNSSSKISSNKDGTDKRASVDSTEGDPIKATRSRGKKSESSASEKSSKRKGRPSATRNGTHLVTTSTKQYAIRTRMAGN
jgi:hypothetical protein